MKKTFLLTLIFLRTAYAENVVELYNDLGKTNKPQYRIIEKNGKFGSMDICEDFTPVKVDVKNGFIHIDNDCPGDGNYVTEIALFRKKSGTPILAINSMFFWSGRVDKAQLKIYIREDAGTWTKVELSPRPSVNLFHLEMPKKTKKYFPILLVAGIPQFGTDIHIYLQAGGVSAIKKRYNLVTDTEEESEWQKGFSNAPPKYDELIYGWDAEQGRFFLKSRCKNGTCVTEKE